MNPIGAAISPVLEIVKLLGDPIVRRISYIKNQEKNFKNLNEKSSDLYSRMEDIKEGISRHGNKMNATSECENWLKNVERLQDQLNEIEKEYSKYKNYLMGWCPDVSLHLKLGKRVVESTDLIINLLEKSKTWVSGVVVDSPTRIVEVIPAPTIEGTTSTECTLQKIFVCIKDVRNRKIGIWGMGGVGKTTVIKILNKSPELTQMFEIVIWVPVSKDWSMRKVQNEIAKRLLLKLESDESNESLARRISWVLERRNFILLLDDMWEKIELDDVGIPSKNKGNCSKVVLTTRRLQVCNLMDADDEIKVEILSDEEARKLFHEKVGDIVNSPSIQSIAKLVVKECNGLPLAIIVVRECNGLPLAIIVVGGSLRKEDNVHVWKNALNELRSPATSEIEDMEEQVFKRLKFSFDRLKNENTKNCFLYAALYPEDYNIPIDEIIEYWRGEGFIDGAGANDKGHAILKNLIDASLLECAGTSHVKMHDVMRDMALRITSSTGEECRFLVRAGLGISEPPKEEEWENVERISLMHTKFSFQSLPQSPYCPKLLTLLLQWNKISTTTPASLIVYLRGSLQFLLATIPASFFYHMGSLRVLDLCGSDIESLPASICNLVSL
ncbi:disease resistance protein RPS5-like [Tasmannia lanceolata]|uniref:disease resistance protein RPS5-like n=1 Tax=Tasmannia lanceolata TaxID=3420 RepID=UPI0040632EDD